MWPARYHVLAQAQTSVLLQICRHITHSTINHIFLRHSSFLSFCFVHTGDTRAKLASAYGDEIVIQVSDNVLHQISSRVFGILAREILNYNVIYEDIQFSQDPLQLNEKEKLFETLEQIKMYVEILMFLEIPTWNIPFYLPFLNHFCILLFQFTQSSIKFGRVDAI